MKKALLPALIAALFASQSAFAADRELLFGPGSATQAEKKSTQESPRKKTTRSESKAEFTLFESREDASKIKAPEQNKKTVAAKKQEIKKSIELKKIEPAEDVASAKEKKITEDLDPKVEIKKAEKSVGASKIAKSEPDSKVKKTNDVNLAPVKTAAMPDAKKSVPDISVAKTLPAAENEKTVTPKTVATKLVEKAPVIAAAASSPAPTGIKTAVAEEKPVVVAEKKAIAEVKNENNQAPVSASVNSGAAVAAPVAPAAPAVAAVTQKLPELKPVATVTGTDPFADRQRLAAQLTDGVTVGFFPSVTGNKDTFSFLTDFLPLANFLSSKTGALVTFVEERNLAVYRRAILEDKYPVIFVNATIVGDAIKAGYVPLAMGSEDLGAGFIVLADSKFKTIDDMVGAQFAWSKNAQITMLAQFELANRNLVDKNKYTDLGTSGRTATLTAVDSGLADVAVMRTTETKKAAADGNGKYREIVAPTVWPASGAWIRKDLKDTDLAKKMTEALLEVAPTATGAAKLASDGFARGFAVKGQFRAVRPGEIEEKSKIVDVVSKSWSDFAYQGMVSESNKLENKAMPVFSKVQKTAGQDVFAENASVRSKYKDSFSVGFYPSTHSSSDAFNFQANYLPLSSYLSEKTGLSVNLVPEPNANEFVERIAKNVYPAIVIGPSMTRAAFASGYIPVARGGDMITPAFVVPVESTIKTIADFANKSIATPRGSAAATIGRSELLKQKADKVDFQYFAESGQGGSVLNTGSVDGLLLRSDDAESLVAKTTFGGSPKYRIILGEEKAPAITTWVRKDIVDNESMQKLSKAMISIGDNESRSSSKAFKGIERGYGTSKTWQASSVKDQENTIQMIEGLIAANQVVVNEAPIDVKAMAKSRAAPFVYPNPAFQGGSIAASAKKAGK